VRHRALKRAHSSTNRLSACQTAHRVPYPESHFIHDIICHCLETRYFPPHQRRDRPCECGSIRPASPGGAARLDPAGETFYRRNVRLFLSSSYNDTCIFAFAWPRVPLDQDPLFDNSYQSVIAVWDMLNGAVSYVSKSTTSLSVTSIAIMWTVTLAGILYFAHSV
jgi:hypothetical protein